MVDCEDLIIVTGGRGFIGSALIGKLAGQFAVVGLDRPTTGYPAQAAECIRVDLTSQDSIATGLRLVRTAYGSRIASVVHLTQN